MLSQCIEVKKPKDNTSQQISIQDWYNNSSKDHCSPSLDLFTSPPWLAVLQETYGFRIIKATHHASKENIVVVLVNDRIGRRLIALPFSDYITPSATRGKLGVLFDNLLKTFPNFSQIITAPAETVQQLMESGWQTKRESVGHSITITSEEDLWRGFFPEFRNKVRQAYKHGLTVSKNSCTESLERFYELHATVRNRKFSALPQPKLFFEKIYDYKIANSEGFILEVNSDANIVASCVVLSHETTLYYKFSASSALGYKLRANNLLLWELLKIAVNENYLTVDLGRSGTNASYAGLRVFKESLGAKTFPVQTLCRSAAVNSPAELVDGQLFAELVKKLCKKTAQGNPSPNENNRVSSLLYRFLA